MALGDERAAGTFPGGGSEEVVSVGLGMMPRLIRAAAGRVRLKSAGWRLPRPGHAKGRQRGKGFGGNPAFPPDRTLTE
jgi:hypothetical protein